MIELTKEYIDHLKDIITEKDDAKIKEILDELYPADIAELYQVLDLQEAIYLYLLDVYKRQLHNHLHHDQTNLQHHDSF